MIWLELYQVDFNIDMTRYDFSPGEKLNTDMTRERYSKEFNANMTEALRCEEFKTDIAG